MLPIAKTSKSIKAMRRAHHALRGVQVTRCPNCGRSRLPHRMCSNCGHVNRSLSVVVRETTE